MLVAKKDSAALVRPNQEKLKNFELHGKALNMYIGEVLKWA